MPDESRREPLPRTYLVLAVLPSIMVSVLGWRDGVRLNLFEAGTTLAGGFQIIGGKTPYTDLFAFYGPLAYLEPGLLGWFGPGLVGLQIGELAASAAMALTAYWLTARISGRPALALMTPAVLALGGSLSHRTLLGLLAVVLLSRWEVSRSRPSIFLAGVLTGAGILYYQDAGSALVVALGLAVVVGLVSSPVHHVLTWPAIALGAAGVCAALLPAAFWLGLRGALDDWFYYCFVYPNIIYTKRSATGYVTGLLASWSGDRPATLAYHVVFYLLPYLVIALTAVVTLWCTWSDAVLGGQRRSGFAPVSTLVLALFAAVQLRTLAASVDEAKLAAAAAPVVILGMGYALRRLGGWSAARKVSPRTRLTAVAALGTLVWFVAWRLRISCTRA